jgi:hypothetical protein
MVIYYHTPRHIFAVTNGYCSAVVDFFGEPAFATLVGSKLLAGVTSDMRDELAADKIDVGTRLKFALGDSNMMTDLITKVELVDSLSIPPSPRSVPPESGREGRHMVTIPDIITIPRSARLPS